MFKIKLLSLIPAVLLGVLFSAIIKIGYALPSVLPTTDIFMYIITSPLGVWAVKSIGGNAGVMIAVLINSFSNSVLIGVLAGIVLHNLFYQRIFFYSTLWLPISNFILGYITLFNISNSDAVYIPKLQEMFGRIIWTNFCVYSWFVMALFISFQATRKFMRNQSAKLVQPTPTS